MTHASPKATHAYAVFCLTVATLLAMPLCAQDAQGVGIAQDWRYQITGLPYDWTHHYLAFSNPGTEEESIQNGTHDQWLTIVNQPRYITQQVRRRLPAPGPAAEDVARIEEVAGSEAARNGEISAEEAKRSSSRGPAAQTSKNQRVQRDWSMDMGSGAKVGANQYPAKFSFSITNAYCDSDTTPDFVVFNSAVAGSATQASIIAYDNLYSGCSGSHPLVYWQYNTAGGTITTSVVLSLDGTQVAFMETGAPASLVLLKWKKGATLTTLANTAAGSYRTCTAPCMTVIPFGSGTANATNSSPFYDYDNDVLYVGDNKGILHKFENIFNSGTPAEITGGGTGSGWPQTIDSGLTLTSPVYDSVTGSVFVGAGNQLHKIAAGGGSSTIVHSGVLGAAAAIIRDSPFLDPVAGMVYAFINADTAATPSNGVYQFPVSFVAGSTGTEAEVGTGTTTAPYYLYDGSFDNAYYTSTSPSSPTGSMYVCGNTGGTPSLYQISINSNALGTVHTGPTLTSGTGRRCSPVTEFFNSPTDWIFLTVNGSGNVGVTGNTCTGACVYSFNVTGFSESLPILPSTEAANGLLVTGGSSGIIIDNAASSPTGASQVYFSTQLNQACGGNGAVGSGTGGCAVQASQSGLR